MNSSDNQVAKIKAYQIGLVSLLISVIFFIFSYLGVGYTTADEMTYELLELMDMSWSDFARLATSQGRIQNFIGYFLSFFPYWISNLFGHIFFNLIYLVFIFTSLALLAVTVYKVTQQKLFAVLVAVFSIVAIQNSWLHNVLTSYTAFMNFPIILLLSSLSLFLDYLSTSKKLFLALSTITLLLALFSGYEFLFLYVAIFVFVAFYNAQITATSKRAAVLTALYTSLPHLIAVMVYLIAYFVFSRLHPNLYAGMKVTQPSIVNALRVIYQYTLSSFPTYVYFHYSNLFSTYSDSIQGHSYTIGNFLEQLKAEWLVKSIVVAYFIYILMQNKLIVISNKMFIGLSVVSVYAMLIPNILVSITERHPQWVANGWFLYTTTYFSYFGTMLLIVSGIAFFSQIFNGNTLIIAILRQCYVWFITIAIAFVSLTTDYSNYYVFKEQKLTQQKWVVLDTFVRSGNLDSVPAGSFVYAPSLWKSRNAFTAGHPSTIPYWTQYLKLKYKKDVVVGNNPEELKNRLAKYDVTNLYYLKFSQEPKDMHQFILLAKVNKIINDDIFLASNAVIVSNSNRQHFVVFGQYLPVNADKPPDMDTEVFIDDKLVQNGGSFFSALVDKQQVNDRYTTTHLKTAGDILFDLESVSISSYTDHRLHAEYSLAPIKLKDQKILTANSCSIGIDIMNGKAPPKQFSIAGKLELVGWLIQSSTQGLPAAASPVVFLTNSQGENTFFRAEKAARPDVATHFNNPALNWAGFRAVVNVSSMPIGNYTLGLGFIEGANIRLCPNFKLQGTINKSE